MCLLGCRNLRLAYLVFSACLLAPAACAVYDGGDSAEPRHEGGVTGGASAGGTGGAGTGGTAGASGASGESGASGNAGAGAGGTRSDASLDADANTSDMTMPPGDEADVAGDATESGSPDDGAPMDTPPPSDVDGADWSDAATGTDANDAAAPPIDAASDGALDAPRPPDADAGASPDADSGARDADAGPTGRQILPQHGTAIEKPDAGGPFDSRCASDEVVTGFVGRAGVQTDAIASTCSKLIGGVLSSPRNLPLNGNLTGGNAFTVTCPSNHVAIGIVGRYGHNTMWMEDVTTQVGVVCKNLASTATQTVTITGQPALDAGYTTFREDCTGGRYLTDISGRTDSNSLGFTVQQVGGECESR